jgi:hypothetical protein
LAAQLSLLPLLSAPSDFLGRMPSSLALGFPLIKGLTLSVICSVAKQDRLSFHIPLWDAIPADLV